MRDKKNATLVDVAKLAGVSTATVSIAINSPDSTRVSALTRQRIEDAIIKLNYKPAAYAQQMKGKKAMILGVMIPDLQNHFYPEVIDGFMESAEKEGYTVVLFDSGSDIKRESSFVDTMISLNVSGVAYCRASISDKTSRELENELMGKLLEEGIPVVQMDQYEAVKGYPYVGINNYQAAYDMTERIIAKGHTGIAALVGKDMSYILSERVRGYRQCMEDHGFNVLQYETDQIRFGQLKDVLYTLCRDHPEVSAVFNLCNDIGAVKCIRHAASLGIRVPEDLSIVGFDDIYIAELVQPGLATVRQPKFEIGQKTYTLLRERMEEEVRGDTFSGVVLPVELIERDSLSHHTE